MKRFFGSLFLLIVFAVGAGLFMQGRAEDSDTYIELDIAKVIEAVERGESYALPIRNNDSIQWGVDKRYWGNRYFIPDVEAGTNYIQPVQFNTFATYGYYGFGFTKDASVIDLCLLNEGTFPIARYPGDKGSWDQVIDARTWKDNRDYVFPDTATGATLDVKIVNKPAKCSTLVPQITKEPPVCPAGFMPVEKMGVVKTDGVENVWGDSDLAPEFYVDYTTYLDGKHQCVKPPAPYRRLSQDPASRITERFGAFFEGTGVQFVDYVWENGDWVVWEQSDGYKEWLRAELTDEEWEAFLRGDYIPGAVGGGGHGGGMFEVAFPDEWFDTAFKFADKVEEVVEETPATCEADGVKRTITTTSNYKWNAERNEYDLVVLRENVVVEVLELSEEDYLRNCATMSDFDRGNGSLITPVCPDWQAEPIHYLGVDTSVEGFFDSSPVVIGNTGESFSVLLARKEGVVQDSVEMIYEDASYEMLETQNVNGLNIMVSGTPDKEFWKIDISGMPTVVNKAFTVDLIEKIGPAWDAQIVEHGKLVLIVSDEPCSPEPVYPDVQEELKAVWECGMDVVETDWIQIERTPYFYPNGDPADVLVQYHKKSEIEVPDYLLEMCKEKELLDEPVERVVQCGDSGAQVEEITTTKHSSWSNFRYAWDGGSWVPEYREFYLDDGFLLQGYLETGEESQVKTSQTVEPTIEEYLQCSPLSPTPTADVPTVPIFESGIDGDDIQLTEEDLKKPVRVDSEVEKLEQTGVSVLGLAVFGFALAGMGLLVLFMDGERKAS